MHFVHFLLIIKESLTHAPPPKFQTYYINESALSIPERFSLQRAYLIFRTLGMRHLTVVDNHNEVVGIVTRKDLMGFNIVERLGQCLQAELHREEHGLEMASPATGGEGGGGNANVV